MEAITQVGVGGVFALLVIREVLNFLAKRKNGGSSSKEMPLPNCAGYSIKSVVYETRAMVADLHKWHDLRDGDGVFVWYVRKSLEEALVKLADSQETLANCIREQTKALERLVHDQEDIKKDLEKIEQRTHTNP